MSELLPITTIIDINLGKATQAIVLAKVRNKISIEFIVNYLLAIAENQ
ncbi:MAG: hypothetical protein HC903_21805 [Methylacidiphilales bacterium]|nr:hypothetical protein [Candidatus Methylacidiphilales bacterium]NJR14439.1 hypothetical protein [Calothrix sp. CSU_2_0]